MRGPYFYGLWLFKELNVHLLPLKRLGHVFAAMLGVILLLGGCSIDRSQQVESHDFSQQEFNRLVVLLLERFDVPLVKNIGFVELPSMGLTNNRTEWLGEHNLLAFDSIAACGALCNDLQRNGYAGEFVAGFDPSDAGLAARAALAAKYYGSDISMEIDNQAFEDNLISPNYNSCLIMPFNQVFRVYICGKAGNFHYAYAIKSSLLKEKNELDYANISGDARFTVEGHVAWYDLYDWVSQNEKN